ncbi:MAG: type II secretion system protein GspG, partial [bacterium]
MMKSVPKTHPYAGVARARGFTLFELVAASTISIILSSGVIGIFSETMTFKRSTTAKNQTEEMRVALEKYFFDTGAFPALDTGDTTGTTGLEKLYRNTDNKTGWKGPYLSGDPRNFLIDPWRSPIRYGTAVAQDSSIPVAYAASLGRNKRLDSALGTFQNSIWDPSGDDIIAKVSSHFLIPRIDLSAMRQLETIRGIIYDKNPNGPPDTYDTSAWIDPWGSRIRYLKCDGKAGTVYSFGPNHTDNNNNGVDICNTNLSAQPDDLMVTASWGQAGNIPWEGGASSEPSECRGYRVQIVNQYAANNLSILY